MTPTNDKVDQSGADERMPMDKYLECLPADFMFGDSLQAGDLMHIVDAALASTQPAPNPVAWIWKYANGEEEVVFIDASKFSWDYENQDVPSKITPLYVTPQPFPAPAVQSAPKTEAWLIESYDANDKLETRVVLAPLTDDVFLDESSEAIALCRLEDVLPTQAIAQTAPAVAGEAIDRVEVLLEVIRCVRGYPDFDEPSWLGEMMDQALAGKTPDALNTIEALSRGVAPSQPVAVQAKALTDDPVGMREVADALKIHAEQCRDSLDPNMIINMIDAAEIIYAASQPSAQSTEQRPVATLRVTNEGYGVDLSTYVAYALPEGLHDVYAAPPPSAQADVAAVNEALEKAAMICDMTACDTNTMTPSDCADAIRALKSAAPTAQPQADAGKDEK